MAAEESQSTISYPHRRRSSTVESIVNTLELVVTALILAFIFRAFVAEAFRIPTGSMAETLKGAHYHLRCVRCGYEYNTDGDQIRIPQTRCPSCGYTLPGTMVPVSNGDRILVAKCIYQFVEPKRWDVIVFKNPTDPRENYIKRLIAGPGEKVEIIDGDVYIDGQIARKPPKVQREMWMTVYDNDYQVLREGRLVPVMGDDDDSNSEWCQPFENETDCTWNLNASGPTVFSLDRDDSEVQTIVYNSGTGNGFSAYYAYNDSASHYARPVCSDLMVDLYVTADRKEGMFGAALSKYGIRYEGGVDFSGKMSIWRLVDDKKVELTSRRIVAPAIGKGKRFRFANVDHQLVLEYDGYPLRYDLGAGPRDLGSISRGIRPEVRLFGSGKMRLWHVKLLRDMHYIGERVLRGGEGRAFTLAADEFFACGDNSPASFDSRLWPSEGIGNEGRTYRNGVVPRDYMMGKAFFVYWADAFKPSPRMLPVIPNFGGLKVIYGGSDGGY